MKINHSIKCECMERNAWDIYVECDESRFLIGIFRLIQNILRARLRYLVNDRLANKGQMHLRHMVPI